MIGELLTKQCNLQKSIDEDNIVGTSNWNDECELLECKVKIATLREISRNYSNYNNEIIRKEINDFISNNRKVAVNSAPFYRYDILTWVVKSDSYHMLKKLISEEDFVGIPIENYVEIPKQNLPKIPWEEI